MNASDSAQAVPAPRSDRTDATWTAAEWERHYPGLLDGIGIAAGAANVILQLAHPAVGYGVVESRVESGSLFKHPFKRARTTLTYLGVALLGTPEEKLAYRKAVSKAHAQVYSTAASPVQYRALDPGLQLWVAACLYWGVEDTYQKVRGPLDPEAAEELYQRCATLGTTLQVRRDMWPPNREAFYAYWNENLRTLTIDDTVRGYLTALTDFKFVYPFLAKRLGPINRFFTTGFLPPEIREQMHFEWGPRQQRRFERLLGLAGAVNRVLPAAVRTAPVRLLMVDLRWRLRRGMPLV